LITLTTVALCCNMQIVTDVEVTIENYFPEVGNIPESEGQGNISK